MASFSINGVSLQQWGTIQGIQTTGNTFTISWNNFSSRNDWEAYFDISASNSQGYSTQLQNSAGTATYLYYVNNNSYADPSNVNKIVSTNGSDVITIPSLSNLNGVRITISHSDEYVGSYTSYYAVLSGISLNPPGIPSVTQSGNNYVLSWTAASLSTGGSAGITYTVVYGNEGETYPVGGNTSATILIPEAYYEQNIRFRVYANYSGMQSVSGDAYFVAHRTSVTAPTNVIIVQNTLKTYTISWSPSYGSYGNPNDKVTYTIWSVSDGSPLAQGLTNTSVVLNISVYNVRLEFRIYAYYGSASSQSSNVAYTFIQPTITKQPEIISINPQQGSHTTITWSAAEVANQFDTSIYYQYFVGPNPTYNDTYHIGDTNNLSAIITEENIISKCGEGEKTCYLFVRAYWIKDDVHGGWMAPTGKPFYYIPDTGALMYYDGFNWIQCNVYYYDGTQWKECIPYIYNGNTWIEGG